MIYNYKFEKDKLSFSINRESHDPINIMIDARYSNQEPVRFFKNVIHGISDMFLNGMIEDDIRNLITVNVIGYRKCCKELDIRYSLALHNDVRSEHILSNTNFYLDVKDIHNCFDIAVQACIDDFNKLRIELGQDFISSLHELYKRLGE